MNFSYLADITDQLVALVRDAPMGISALILFGAALIEYIFPPFPGDTVMVAGGFFAAQGAISIYLVFLVLVLGSVAGCALGWSIGRAAVQSERGQKILSVFVKTETIERLQRAYKRYGIFILISNRFLPGIRGAFMIAAGLAHFPLSRVIIWGALSALIWNSLLITLGYFFGANLESLISLLERYTNFMLMIIGSVILLALLWWVISIIKKRRSP